MKIKHQISIATLLMAGVFVTGCSSQQQVSGSQQQVEETAVVVANEIVAPQERKVVKRQPPVKQANPWSHFHPEAPACAKTKSHVHKYAKTGQAHRHNYGCLANRRPVAPAQPQVDVRALQLKLQAKGYYKGPIDGVVGPETRTALQRFMKR